MAGQFTTSPARQMFEQTVIARAASAKAALPGEGTRIDRGRDLVLANCVHPQADGGFIVHSTSERSKSYPVTAAGCIYPDVAKAPEDCCTHLLATWIWRKARSAISGQHLPPEPAAHNGHVTAQDAPQSVVPISTALKPQEEPKTLHGVYTAVVSQACALPEAAASMNCYVTSAGYRVQVTIRGDDEQQLRLGTFLSQFPPPVEPSQVLSTPATPMTPEGWCRLYDEQMTHWPGKDGRTAWWSHGLADGTWCTGR